MNSTAPGINTNFLNKKDRFQPATWEIIEIFSKFWYVTSGQTDIKIAESYYDTVFLKPTATTQEKFNLEREIIVIFNNYATLEPRSFDAIDKVRSSYQKLRFEEICSVMVCGDNQAEKKVSSYLKTNRESQIVVPFSYKELQKKGTDQYFIENRFRKYFYNRDLFAFESALQKDIYFFGRKDIIQIIVNRHLSFENTGIFGLRKTGKTSILFAVQRTLELKEKATLLIDCQDTSVYEKRWFEVLYLIVKNLYKNYNVNFVKTESHYTKETASEQFSDDIIEFKNKTGKSVLFMFDEVERITFGVSDNKYWRNGNDFTSFWRSIRANLQKHQLVYSYLIASTNPKAVEETSFGELENPIFSQTQNHYIKQFDIQDTKEMVEKLGGYMGLKFKEELYTYLTRDYGGHPFLIRHVCSTINSIVKEERPVTIDRIIYEKGKKVFEQELSKGFAYSQMILEVLEKHYPDEYTMLEALSIGDDDFFYSFAEESHLYTAHLIGYGILTRSQNKFDFRIDTLKSYLATKNKYKRLKLSHDEKRSEISTRRNRLEKNLRRMVKKQLQYALGKGVAKNEILKLYNNQKQKHLSKLSYEELFDSGKGELYFDQLRVLLGKYWEQCFRNIFETDVEKFKSRMSIINEQRYVDAHAGEISDDEFQSFRGAMSWLENHIKSYFE